MIDIVAIIKEHTDFLQQSIEKTSVEQRVKAAASLARFFFRLPVVMDCFDNYLKLSVSEEEFCADILSGNTARYREALATYDEGVDPYADDFEELDPLEIFVLDGIQSCIWDMQEPGVLAGISGLVIDVLDYYENFSEQPAYWNEVLEREVTFQHAIIETLTGGRDVGMDLYYEKYNAFDFSEI